MSREAGKGTGADAIELLQRELLDFARARDRERYHTPRNLAALIASEAGELLALFRWDEDATASRPDDVRHEVADVFLGILRLADIAEIDLVEASREKLRLNAIKYPAQTRLGGRGSRTAHSPSIPSLRLRKISFLTETLTKANSDILSLCLQGCAGRTSSQRSMPTATISLASARRRSRFRWRRTRAGISAGQASRRKSSVGSPARSSPSRRRRTTGVAQATRDPRTVERAEREGPGR